MIKRLFIALLITALWAVGATVIINKLQTCAQSLPATFDASGHMHTLPPSSWSHLSIVHLCPANQGLFSQTDFSIQLAYLFIVPFFIILFILSVFRKR